MKGYKKQQNEKSFKINEKSIEMKKRVMYNKEKRGRGSTYGTNKRTKKELVTSAHRLCRAENGAAFVEGSAD